MACPSPGPHLPHLCNGGAWHLWDFRPTTCHNHLGLFTKYISGAPLVIGSFNSQDFLEIEQEWAVKAPQEYLGISHCVCHGPRPSEVFWFWEFSVSGYHCPEGGVLVPVYTNFQASQLGIGDRKTANIPFQNLLLDNSKLYSCGFSALEC